MTRSKKRGMKMKKPFLQRKWVWVVISLVILIVFFEVNAQFNKWQNNNEREKLTAAADDILKGKVKVPETYFKSQEFVETEFKKVGLAPSFVVVNFDEKATTNNRVLKKGECDQIDSSQSAIHYFSPDEVGDKFGFYADKGSTITVGYSDHDFDGRKNETGSSSEIADSATVTSEKTSTTSTGEKTKSSSKAATPSNSMSEDLSDDLKETNKLIEQHLKENQGWALGTIDNNGNPTEDGEPNIEYANWLYVRSIKYTGDSVEVQVTADFKALTKKEKNTIASSIQGIVMSYGLLESRPSIYIYNGENAYGNSKLLSPSEYTWN